MPEPLIIAVRGRTPQIHPGAWVVPNASVIDQVTLAARASVCRGLSDAEVAANRHNAAFMNACSSCTA
jgi:carbonic anhydrase/acetyltransferase-like protein (isoleucine patch superfamily)